MADGPVSPAPAFWRSLVSPSLYRTPPGPPVALGAALAVWLFARSNVVELMLALIVACLVSTIMTRALAEAEAAKREAAALRGKLADIEFGMRTSSRVSWAIDFDRREVRCSAGVVQLLGAAPAFEDAAKAAPSFVHPEDRASVIQVYADALEKGEAGPVHVRFVRQDGDIRWVRYGLKARRQGARLEEVFAVATDFTDFQKRGQRVMRMMAEAERQLAQSRPELDALLRDIGVDIPAHALSPHLDPAAPGDGRQFDSAAARFGRIVQEFAARRHAFHQAVDALKRARRTSDMFAQIADRCDDAMMIFGVDGMLEWTNPAFERMTGWALEEVKGKDIRKLLAGPETNLQALADLSAQLHARGEGACELMLYRRDGQAYWADVRGGRVRADDRASGRTYLIKRDLTARKKMEAELEAALVEARSSDAAKSQFLANMSHELRTPLNAVIGYSEMLQEELGDSESGRDAGRIREAGARLLSVINGIIDLARAGAQRIDVLVVDSDRTGREAALRTIARLGFSVAGAEDLDAALAHRDERPALAVVNCTGEGGWTALEHMRAAFPQAPLLALVGPGEGPRAASAGAAGFLVHPVGLMGLAAAVARYARRPDEPGQIVDAAAGARLIGHG